MRCSSTPRKIICSKCGNNFLGSHSQAKYCSPNCSRLGERESWRRYGERNRERRREYHRELYAKKAETVIKRTKKYKKTPAGRRAQKINDLRQREKHPEKYDARQAVGKAWRAGRLKKMPCQVCGSNRKVQAHHVDYKRPLDVEWLCEPHHRALHRQVRLPHG